MVDIDALKKAIEDSGITMTALSSKLGVSRETLYNRFAGKGEFTVSEIQGLTDILHLTAGQRNAIFFKQ